MGWNVYEINLGVAEYAKQASRASPNSLNCCDV